MADQDDYQRTVSVGAEPEPDKPQELDEYTKLVAEVFDAEQGKELLAIWLRDYTRQGINVPGDPISSHGRAAVADFLLQIVTDLEIAHHVRRNT